MFDLGAYIKYRRGNKSLSAVAEEIGVSKATLSRIEAGKHPTYGCYLKIAAWLQPGGDTVMQMMEVQRLKFQLELAEQERDQVRGFYDAEQAGRFRAIQLIAGFHNARKRGMDFGDDLNRELLTFLRNDPVLRTWIVEGADALDGIYGYERMEQALRDISIEVALFREAHQSTLDDETLQVLDVIYRLATGQVIPAVLPDVFENGQIIPAVLFVEGAV